MNKVLLYLMALALLAVSCGKEENIPSPMGNDPVSEVKMITEVVSGGRAATKATINASAAFAWTFGDKVAVHVSNGDSHRYVVTSSGASVAGASASFSVQYEEGYSRDAFAVYPSTIVAENAANYGQSGQPLDVTLPSSYTLDQVSGETSPCPMIATNAPDAGWAFYQLCGLLRLTVNSIPPSTKRLEIDFNGNKVWGNFSITQTITPGTSDIKTATGSENDVIKIFKEGATVDVTLNNNAWLDGLVLNIPLPTGDYTNITVTAYNALSGGDAILVPLTLPFGYTASNQYGTKRTASFPVFSVSADKRVLFSPGNLQASTSDYGAHWTWGFAANQWDYIGASYYHNQRISGNGTVKFVGDPGKVDLFGWVGASNTTWSGDLGTTLNAAMYGITSSKTLNSADTYGNVADESLKSDWGNTINDEYTWRTPAADEWSYLLGTRTRGGRANGTNNPRFTLARINTDGTAVCGLILFPDGVTIESSEVTKWGNINKEIGESSMYTWDSYATQCTTAQWAALATKGCVFLPCAGYRYLEGNNTPVSGVGGAAGYAGYYWSSSPVNASQAYFVLFIRTFVDPNSASKKLTVSDRYYGHSVRLVRDIN